MTTQPHVFRSVNGLQHRVMSAFEWGRTPKDYRGVIEDSVWTGWPVGTRTAMYNDPKDGTCLTPVIVDPLEATKENATLVGTLIETALARLGPTTADAVANLRDLGIKGKRRCAGACVLYNYLMEHGSLPEFGGDFYIEVAHPQIAVWHRYSPGSRDLWIDVRTPDHLRVLTTGFDEGKFPELDENPDEIQVQCDLVGDFACIEVFQGGAPAVKWSGRAIFEMMDDGFFYCVAPIARRIPSEVGKLTDSVIAYCKDMKIVR